MFGIHLHRPELIHVENLPFVPKPFLTEYDRSRRVKFYCHSRDEHHRPEEKENGRTDRYIKYALYMILIDLHDSQVLLIPVDSFLYSTVERPLRIIAQ